MPREVPRARRIADQVQRTLSQLLLREVRDPRLGFFEELSSAVRREGVEVGRIDVSLLPSERNVGLTVNEYETLLMQHDLTEVLRDPLRFMAARARNMLRDPGSIPTKTLDYAKYDLVHVFNEAMDHLRISESTLERILSRFLALPAARFLLIQQRDARRYSVRGAMLEEDKLISTWALELTRL